MLLTAGSLFVGLPWARASVGQPVGDGQAVTLDGTFSPGKVGRLPELAGPGFATTSVTAAFYGQVSTASGNYVPALGGDELLYLSVSLYSFAPPLGNSALTYEADFAPALAVNFAGSSVPLPGRPRGSINGVAGSKYGDQGELYSGQWLVALPKNVPVTLTATENGFTQTLDVRNATRVGETPTVLYRSSSGPLALDVRGNLAATLVVDAGGNQVRFPVTLNEAFLGFFDLSSVNDTPAAAPAEAYLFASVSIGTGVDGSGRADWFLDPSGPGQAVTVAVDGGAPVTAARAPAAPGLYGVGNTGSPSGGLFGFLVPAGVASATVVVGTGPDPSVYYQGPNDNAATVEAVSSSTPATFKVAFPAASSPAPTSKPPTLATSPVPTPARMIPAGETTTPSRAQVGQATPASQKHGGSGWWPIGVGASAGVTGIVLFGLFLSRRTRSVGAQPPKTPDEEGQPQVPPMTSGGATSDGDSTYVVAGSSGESSDHLGIVAAGPATSPRLKVGVLGPLVVEGTGEIHRKMVLRALIVLALFLGNPISSEELRGWLAESEYSEPGAGSLRSELSRLRRVLPDGLLPDLGTGSGYALAVEDVDVDWINFDALANRANAAVGYERIDFGLQALRLVRGRVLEHQSWHGIDRMVWDMNVSIETLAANTAIEALTAGRPGDAAETAFNPTRVEGGLVRPALAVETPSGRSRIRRKRAKLERESHS